MQRAFIFYITGIIITSRSKRTASQSLSIDLNTTKNKTE